MCGRYVLTSKLEELKQKYGAVPDGTFTFEPVYNVAPSFDMPVVLEKDRQRRIRLHRWGLIPHWARDEKMSYSMINARSETLAKKPAFRDAYKKRRCVVPANGFYEWKGESGNKQPYYITRTDGELMPFAGLYEEWTSEEGKTVDSFTIVTTDANRTIEPLHDRMPAILAGEEEIRSWLNPDEQNPDLLGDLLRPYPDDAVQFYAVSKAVNNPRNQGEELIEPEEDLFS